MDGDRLARLLAALVDDDPEPVSLERLCRLYVHLLPADGVGIALMTADAHQATLCGSDQVTESLDQLQFTLGEGPAFDVRAKNGPVLEADLEDAASRWPIFATSAISSGTRAVFAFPLHVGAARLGVLSFYRAQIGDLASPELADALVLADAATHLLLALQAGASADSLAWQVASLADHEAQVHQATGMVAAQLEVNVGEALVRLRAYAWANGRTVGDVAADVVMRRLRLAAA